MSTTSKRTKARDIEALSLDSSIAVSDRVALLSLNDWAKNSFIFLTPSLTILKHFALALLFTNFLNHFSLASESRLSNEEFSEAPLVLGIGTSELLKVPQNLNIHISQKGVFSLRDMGSTVLITGRKLGESMIRFGNRKTRVLVVGKKEFRDHQVLQRVMSKMMGLHLDINDGAPTITGQLLRVKDWVEITKAGQTNSAKYRFRAEIDELIKPKVLAYLKQTLKNSALPSYKILLDPHPQFIIPKASDEKSLHPLLESVAKSHGIEIFEDSNALDILPMIKVRIFVAEIKKKAFQRIGLGPPTSASAQLVPAIGIGPLAATLNFLEERGDATLLASPSLLCRSGKEAEFLAGGEIPIKISGFGSKEVVWRKYGILLKVKPKATWDGRMSVDLLTEVSNLDPAQTVEGVPGLLTNRIQSHFDLEGTQTIALSGLIRHDKGFSAEGWPGLNRIPILGSLFSSQDYRDQKTELVFFVRPEVTDSAANGEFNQSWDDPSIKSENEFNSPSEPRTEEGSLHE